MSDEVPSRVLVCVRKHNDMPSRVPFQWRIHDAVPQRVLLCVRKHLSASIIFATCEKKSNKVPSGVLLCVGKHYKVPSRVPFQLIIYDYENIGLTSVRGKVVKCHNEWGK